MKLLELNNNTELKEIKSHYQIFEDFVFENYTLQKNEVTNQEIIIRNEDNEQINMYDLLRDLEINNIKAGIQKIKNLFKTSQIEAYSPFKSFFHIFMYLKNGSLMPLHKYLMKHLTT